MAEQRPAIYDSNPKLGELRDNVLFGDVWEQTDLSKCDRSLLTITALISPLSHWRVAWPYQAHPGQRGHQGRNQWGD